MMNYNKLRYILKNDLPSIATRLESSWPTMTEIVGKTGLYDYIEFVGEYAPYNLYDLENIARAAELHDMGSIIKVDLQNRFYVGQKALASGFQGLLLVDHKTPEEVRESLFCLKPDRPQSGGRFGYPNSRWIGYEPHKDQMDYADMVDDTVILLMIEKKEAMDNIEEICSIPGVDMVQFGPSDYSMSNGWNMKDHIEDCKAAERKMIEVALAHGVQPRCEIYSPEDAKYYMDLGVKHFCLGDELKIVETYWKSQGEALKQLAKK